MSDNLTPAETVRFVEGGKLCQGILFTNDLDEVVKPREKVLEVKDNIKFKKTSSIHKIHRHTFKSEITRKVFENNIDKHIPERFVTVGENVWGIGLESSYSTGLENQGENYISSVFYQLVPARTVHLESNDLELRPEVITELKRIETSLIEADYVPSGHFTEFFERYGSHVNHGPVEFGGIFISTACCEGFHEQDRAKFSAAATEASEAVMLYGFSKNVRPGIPVNASEVLGKTSGICTEDVKNLTATMRVIGGPDKVAEKDEWKRQTSENSHQWRVISRNLPPKPIWTFLIKYKDELKNHSKLEEAMVEEWRRVFGGTAWVDKMAAGQQDPITKTSGVEEEMEVEEQGEKDNLERMIRERAEPMEKEKMQEKRREEKTLYPRSKDTKGVKKGRKEKADETKILEKEMELAESKKRRTTEKLKDDLRRDVQNWLERYTTLDQHNINDSIKDLADLRIKHDKINKHWRWDVLELHHVQKNITWAVQYVDNVRNHMLKNELIKNLRTILHPFEKIESYETKVRHRIHGSQLQTLIDQLSFLRHKPQVCPEADVANGLLDPVVQDLLAELHMEKYYPQKLKFDDVIKLTSELYNSENKKPATLPELPWFFIRNIIGLKSDTREHSHVIQHLTKIRDDSSEDSEDSESDEDILSAVHPLDLIYIIFLCADDFLRQELVEKMARCQFAVPFVLPPPYQIKIKSDNLMLHWGLKGVARIFLSNKKVVNETLVDVKMPLVTCINTKKETSWKSKLLNKMLSPQQETFWHQGLKGGNCKQRISQGMVEVGWFLPGNQEDNEFPYPVTFANIRERALHSDDVCLQLHEHSSVTCIFAEDIDDELLAVLDKVKDTLQKVLLIVLYKSDKRRIRKKIKEIQARFNLTKEQTIIKRQDDANFISVYEALKEAITNVIQMDSNRSSMSQLVKKAKANNTMEVDDRKCYVGLMAAESILKAIDEYNRKSQQSAKAKMLPCQSDLKTRKEIAALDKEFCRQRQLNLKETTMESHAYRIKAKKFALQKKQLGMPISDSFREFLLYLHSLGPIDRKYFLQHLKLGLNQRSIQQLQPLHDEYDKISAEKESKERNEHLADIDEKLSHGSLGTEHFFREMAIMYENMQGLKQDYIELAAIQASLSQIMADVLLDGTAIEIMDGDAVDVPAAWLSSVFAEVEKRMTSTLFKVSALGAQSCGKSTLLNTMFGLNFPVSSGRCTRGAFMQLVKVDTDLQQMLHCGFVVVIDSEGLMSRSKTHDSQFDNELSTFIIGLSDLTLVIIKGEGNEMQDLLPMAIHVFMKMKVVGEHQACHFVHQNMGAVDTMSKVAREIDAFVRDLNVKTEAAAKDVDEIDRYKKFSDVLYYNAKTDNTYVPGLWDGSLPMAKINLQYSQLMQKIKSVIIRHIIKMSEKQKKPGTFEDMKDRLNELWNAIKYENFVLSFKNVLAVEAHKKLSKIFDEKQWALKRAIRAKTKDAENKIENEITQDYQGKTVQQLTHASALKLVDVLSIDIADIEAGIQHYFNCPGGCKSEDCKVEVKNRHLLANNEKEFMDEVRHLKTALEREIESSMETLERKLSTEKRIYEMRMEMDQIIKEKVQEAIRTRKSHKNWTDREIDDIFDTLWREVTGDILSKTRRQLDDPHIRVNVEKVVRRAIGTDYHLYVQIHTDGSRSDVIYGGKFWVGAKHIKVRQNMMQKGFQMVKSGFSRSDPCASDADIRRLQIESENIIEHTKKHYTMQREKSFNEGDVEELFKDVVERIDGIKDEKFKTTTHYKVELICYIERLAKTGFEEIHAMYQRDHSPNALLEKKKKSYHAFFCIEIGHGNAAAKFCENVLKEIILQNIDKKLSNTELLHTLRIHCVMFKDIKAIQAAIMIDLFRDKQSKGYLTYTTNYEGQLKWKMKMESIRCLDQEGMFKDLAMTTLHKIIQLVLDAVKRTVDSPSNETFTTKALFAELEILSLPHDNTAPFRNLEVPDKRQFGSIVREKLAGHVKNAVAETIDQWDVEKKLEEKGLTDFLFKEVVGCKEVCPFCKVPCDAHSGGKTQGRHSATLHRPKGLGGVRQESTDKLVTGDCCSAVASNDRFRNALTQDEWHPYKEYQKLYPDWTIYGNADPDVEKYWKWVLAKYNSAFAKYYNVEEADVPDEWGKFKIEEISEDIEKNYKINVDLDQLQ